MKILSMALPFLLIATCLSGADAPPGDPAPSREVGRGEYLVRIMGCTDCHTPMTMGANGPEPDLTQFMAGHPARLVMPPAPVLEGAWGWAGSGTNTAFAGPWGVSYAANLTPDPDTGLGRWSERTFTDAIRAGRHEGRGRPILPPMPTAALASATDEDLLAIFAYLRSLPPIQNRVPRPVDPPEAD